MVSIVVQCVSIYLLIISIVVPCIGIILLMLCIGVHCIAYDKHSCAMHWN